MTTYYDVLGVDESASQKEIKSAYKNQVKKYHPDKSDHPDSNDLFIDLQKAKENLPQITKPVNYDLNYEWNDGDPIEPASENDENEREKKDRSDDSDPWNSTNSSSADPDPNDKSNVNVGDDGQSNNSQNTGSSTHAEDADTRNRQDNQTSESRSNSNDHKSHSTTQKGTVGSTVWHKLIIGSTLAQVIISIMGSSGSLLLSIITFLSWIGLPVGIYFDSKKTIKCTSWPKYGKIYIISTIIPVIAIVPGMFYLWRRNSKVPDGPTTSGDQLSTSSKVSSLLTRRNAIGAALGGGLLFLISDQSDGTESSTESGGFSTGNAPQEVTVSEPSESIQNAINNVASGGTVRVSSGVYSEGIVVEKNISIISNDGATLEGSEIDVNDGISIEADDVSIDGLSVAGFYTGIAGGSRDANITISNLELNNLDYGISVEANSLNARNATIRDHDNSGIHVVSTRNGDVTISDCIIEESGQEIYEDINDGLTIEGASEILIEDSEFANNNDSSIVIYSGNVNGQSIDIIDTVTVDSGNTGIYIEGTRGSDDVVISNVESTRDEIGMWIGDESEVASVEIQSVDMEGHRENGIEIYSTREGSVAVSDIFIDHDNEDVYDDGTPLLIEGGQNVSIQESEFLSGTNDNIMILSGSTNGQSISIVNTDSAGAVSGSGVTYEGSRGEDEITLKNAEVVNNSYYGIDIAGEEVTLDSVTATGNEESNLHLRDIDRSEANITDSTLSE